VQISVFVNALVSPLQAAARGLRSGRGQIAQHAGAAAGVEVSSMAANEAAADAQQGTICFFGSFFLLSSLLSKQIHHPGQAALASWVSGPAKSLVEPCQRGAARSLSW